MSGIAGTISRTDAADLASYYSQQPIHPDPVKNQAAADIGKRIFLAGDGSGRVRPCAMCHGAGRQRPGMGMMGHGMMGPGPSSNVPRLNGQHATYVIDQLNRFADGRRSGTVMGPIAASLSDTERKAVAEYVSGLHALNR